MICLVDDMHPSRIDKYELTVHLNFECLQVLRRRGVMCDLLACDLVQISCKYYLSSFVAELGYSLREFPQTTLFTCARTIRFAKN